MADVNDVLAANRAAVNELVAPRRDQLDLDVRGFFDNLDWELLMKVVKKHAQEPWVVLYIERWLKTPAQEEDGTLVERKSGTPQGGVISPLLANLFLHYAFDVWMRGSIRICRSRGMPMMPSCIAGRSVRLRRFGVL